MPPNYRRCVSCRQVGPKGTFWRIVRVHPARTIQLGEGMGRSAYLCPRASCLKQARQKNRLGRALRAPVGEDIYRALEARLVCEELGGDR